MPAPLVRTRFLLIAVLVLALVAALVGLRPLSASAASANVAQLTIYSDGTSVGTEGVGGLAKGHAFLSVKNTSKSTIAVGELTGVKAGETVTVGTWGNKSEHSGIWYNLESYFIKQDLAAFATVSLTMNLTLTQLKTLNTGIDGRDSYNAITNNCSSFASAMWNRVASKAQQLTARNVLTIAIDSPTGLMVSIDSKSGNQTGLSSSIPWSGRGVLYGQGTKSPKASTKFLVSSTPTPTPTPTPTSNAVTFADDQTKACVLDEYKSETGTSITSITQAQLATLTQLNCAGDSLSGLEYATNLKSFRIGGYCSDLTPLLGLTHLTSIATCLLQPGSDLSQLAKFTNLTNLEIENSDLTSATALQAMTKLTSLSIDTNSSADFSSLLSMPSLTTLIVNEPNFFDASTLAPRSGLNLIVQTHDDLPNTTIGASTSLPTLTAPDESKATNCTFYGSTTGAIANGAVTWSSYGQGEVACTASGTWGSYSMVFWQYVGA